MSAPPVRYRPAVLVYRPRFPVPVAGTPQQIRAIIREVETRIIREIAHAAPARADRSQGDQFERHLDDLTRQVCRSLDARARIDRDRWGV